MMTQYEVRIPKSIDIDKMLLDHPMDQKLKRDKLVYIISMIYPLALDNLDNWHNGEWVIINATILKGIISNYKEYLTYLEDEVKIIECNGSYSVGGWSLGYRFKHLNHIAIEPKQETLTDKTLLKAIEKSWTKNHFGNDYVKNNLPYLNKWFNNKLKLELEHHSKATLINEGNYRVSVDKFGKRLHSPFTRLWKEHRKHLRYDGQQLVEIDIKSSQPYLCIKLVLDEIFEVNPQLKEQFDGTIGFDEKMTLLKDYEGVERYITDVIKSDIYLELKTKYENEYGESLGERDEYKKLMMTNLFTANGYNPKGKQLFTNAYPFVSSVFKKIKKSDRKELSRVLQRLESKLVLRVICKEINQHNKNIPLLTIHDSILTIPEHWEEVQRITREVLLREIGFNPELHITKHDQ